MNNSIKKIYSVGEDVMGALFRHLETQAVKDVLPIVDALRAIVANHSNDAANKTDKVNDNKPADAANL